MEDCPLVMIEWEDNARPVPEWRWLSDYRTVNAVRCTSVGWMTHDSAEVKALAPNLGEIGSSKTMQASGVIRIPSRCVVRVVHLTKVDAATSSLKLSAEKASALGVPSPLVVEQVFAATSPCQAVASSSIPQVPGPPLT